jgi:D-alanyl-D-alanine carboxypeptidase
MRSPVAVYALCFALLVPGIANAGWTAAGASHAHDLLARYVQDGQTPTISVCVSVDGNTVYAHSEGQVTVGVPATPDMIYRIGSVSKQFTAAGILALIEDGATVPSDHSAFSLASPLPLFFPSAPQFAPVTVRRLLTMTSNIPSYTTYPPPGLPPTLPVDASQLLDAILKAPLVGQPKSYNYSNTNYFLLASIIDELYTPGARRGLGAKFLFAHPGYRAYLKKRIFARAGLTATNFIDDPAPLGTMVPPVYKSTPPQFGDPSWPKGAGAIRTNVYDLCKWDAALMSGKVIGAASLATMGTPAVLTSPATANAPASYYAMGWAVRTFPDRIEYSHNGEIPGYTAQNMINVYKSHFVAVAILTNTDSVPGLDLMAYAIAQDAAP